VQTANAVAVLATTTAPGGVAKTQLGFRVFCVFGIYSSDYWLQNAWVGIPG